MTTNSPPELLSEPSHKEIVTKKVAKFNFYRCRASHESQASQATTSHSLAQVPEEKDRFKPLSVFYINDKSHKRVVAFVRIDDLVYYGAAIYRQTANTKDIYRKTALLQTALNRLNYCPMQVLVGNVDQYHDVVKIVTRHLFTHGVKGTKW